MKLSEAILLGSVSTGQAFYILEDPQGNTCAKGSALKAMGLCTSNDKGYQFANDTWPFLRELEATICPECNCSVEQRTYNGDITKLIPHLNDIHKWTRPRIAAHVATLEPQDEQVTNTIIEEIYHEVK